MGKKAKERFGETRKRKQQDETKTGDKNKSKVQFRSGCRSATNNLE